jgi:hypothetical protein
MAKIRADIANSWKSIALADSRTSLFHGHGRARTNEWACFAATSGVKGAGLAVRVVCCFVGLDYLDCSGFDGLMGIN